jgi:hypothetical protein
MTTVATEEGIEKNRRRKKKTDNVVSHGFKFVCLFFFSARK